VVIKSKSARQARGGVLLATRMFDYQISEHGIGGKRKGTNPFEVPVCKPCVVDVVEALGCTVQLLPHF